MTRLLVSVRDVPEALLAAGGGADFIDLKEPRDGALGGLALPTIAAVVAALRARGITRPVSATIGDLGMDQQAEILARVRAVAACGVDYVKVGIEPAPGAAALLEALAAAMAGGTAIIPVFIVDRGLDAVLLRHACTLGFPALMVDTADKRAGSLFDVMTMAELRQFIDTVRAAGALAGLAGALRLPHLPSLAGLRPDFAGFRTAVCAGDRRGTLDLQRLRALANEMRLGHETVPMA